MFRFYRLLTIFGVPVHAQGILLPLVLLLAWTIEVEIGDGDADFLTNLGFVVAVLAGPVLLHELGHCFVARRCGVATRRLLLTPVGAFANFDRPVTDPRTVFRIALAGPMVNLALALPLMFLSGQFPGSFLPDLVNVTLFLAVLGLSPGVPRDGSRILRSILSRSMKPLEAALVTCRTGQLVAVAGGVVAFSYSQALLVGVAVCVFFASQIELLVERVRASPAGRLSEMFRRSFSAGSRDGSAQGARPDGFFWSWSFESARQPDSERVEERPEDEIEAPRHADGDRVIDVDSDGKVKKIWEQ